jgi:hypothetical protein
MLEPASTGRKIKRTEYFEKPAAELVVILRSKRGVARVAK